MPEAATGPADSAAGGHGGAMEAGRRVASDPTMRFDIHARLQHGMLALSLGILMLTGFPIKYAHATWAPRVVRLFGDFETMLQVHLAAAVLLALVVVYHLVMCLWGLVGRRLDFAVLPRLRDFGDFAHHLAYLAGFRSDAPRFGKFTWWEKFEYWALIWGVAVMGITGLMLWFPIQTTRFLPGVVIPAAKAAHGPQAARARHHTPATARTPREATNRVPTSGSGEKA